MKWGILFASTGFPDAVSAVDLARSAEAAGFESLWAPEHVVVSPNSQVGYNENDHWDRLYRRGGIPDPLMWLTFVAAHTRIAAAAESAPPAVAPPSVPTLSAATWNDTIPPNLRICLAATSWPISTGVPAASASSWA